MKKIFTLLLALCMLCLCACGGGSGESPAGEGGSAEGGKLLVGYARVDITPEDNVAMAIYGSESERISTGYMDKLYGYALAVTGTNGETVLILTCDHSWYHKTLASTTRMRLMDEFEELKEENIICTGTHNHSAPSPGTKDTSTTRYADEFTKAMIEAGKKAMEDRKEATMYAGSAKATGLNFVRRYILKDGTTPNFETPPVDQIAGHESEPDDQLQVIRFAREGERDIAVYNWQAHVNMNMQTKENYNLLTSDIFGTFRDEVEKKLDVDVFIWNGAAGNLNPTSKIPDENPTWDHREYGKLLSKPGVEAFESATEVPAGAVNLVTDTYTGTVNHEFDNVVNQAQQVLDYYKKTSDDKGSREMGKEYGINTYKHASRIISNAKLGATEDILLKAFSIGDIGFICLRYEMFDTNGMQIKEGSPYKMTFILTYCNGANGYIPSELAWEHGGYEVYKTKFARGTAELIVDQFLNMLNDMYNN